MKDIKRMDMFLYLLLRDTSVPCGEIERLTQEAEKIKVPRFVIFSNKYLAEYAQNIRIRLDNDSVK